MLADSDVDLAAILMRLLFIKDLRGLQDSIDDAIVDVQVNIASTESLATSVMC